ncbi:MAG: hypothetical protein JRJ84_00190 [Deltaproteobacteria bacterium]|nr:hypothetical protein [Deltaproteobacteria bacterium]
MLRFFLLCILTSAGVAHAERLPTLAVVGIHQSQLTPDEQRRASEALVRTIEDSHFFTALTLADLEPALAGRESLILQDAFLGPGRELLDDGKQYYNQAQPEQALPLLQDAARILRLAMATSTSTRDLWEAWVYVGATHLLLGEGREAREAFQNAVSLNPFRTPNTAEFPPHIVERHEVVRRERTALASTLTVEADEADTLIWLNGIERGAVPITIDDVVPGENFLHARSPNGFFAFETVEVPEADTKRVSLRLGEPSLGYSADSRFARSRQVSSLYRTLGDYLSIDLILLAGTLGDQLVLQLYSPRTDGFSRPVEVAYRGSAADEAVAAITTVLSGVRQDGTFDPTNRAPLPAPLDVGNNQLLARTLVVPREAPFLSTETGPRTPKWITWGVVGLAGAAVAAGTVWGVSYALTEPHQGTIIVGPPE